MTGPLPSGRDRRIGPYRIVGTLGQGGMGTVVEAEAPSGGRVAVKIVSAEHARQPRRLARLEREAAAARAVDHPGIARLLDVGVDAGTPFLVFELVRGGTLRDELRRGPLPWRDAARLGTKLASALAAIHDADLIHRDVKPDNILLDAGTGGGRREPKLADFGVAKAATGSTPLGFVGDLTGTREVVGTIAYMAPEQIAASRDVGPPADLYALGATLHEAIVGTCPFEGSMTEIAATKVARGAPSLAVAAAAREVPATLVELVDRLLDRDATRRGTAREAAQALERIARATAPRLASRSSGGRSPRAVAAAVGVAVLAGAGGSTAVLLLGRDGPPPSVASGDGAPDAALGASATDAEPVIEAPPGHRLHWSLATGPAPELTPGAALWPDAATADPWPALSGTDPEAVPLVFAGEARPVGDGRVMVRYPASAFDAAMRGPGTFFLYGDAEDLRPSPVEGPGGRPAARWTSADQAGPVLISVGRAFWTEARLVMDLRAETIDATNMALTRRPASGPKLGMEARRGWLYAGSAASAASLARASFAFPGPWRRLEVDTSRERGRVLVDGREIAGLGDGLAPDDRPSAIVLNITEMALSVGSFEVTGRAHRGDHAARALVPGPLAGGARIEATFRRDGPGVGGPLLALVSAEGDAIELEADRSDLVLRHGRRELARARLGEEPPRRGRLVLERRADALIGRFEPDPEDADEVAAVQLAAGDPFPLRGGGVRAAYGSTAPRIRFDEVTVFGAIEADPLLAAFDAAADGALLDAVGGPSARARWRAGAARLRTVVESAAAPAGVFGERGAPRRLQVGLAATTDLLAAAAGLEGPARTDALARAVLAAVVAGQLELAREAALAVATEPDGRRVLDELHVFGGDPMLLTVLAEGWIVSPADDEASYETALEAADLVLADGDPRRGAVLHRKALLYGFHRGHGEEALELLGRARRHGMDPVVCDGDAARLLARLGRYDEALARFEAALAGRPDVWFYWWSMGAVLAGEGRGAEAVEAFVAALSYANRPNLAVDLRRILLEGAETIAPGHLAAGFLVLHQLVRPESLPEGAHAQLRVRALAAAARASGDPMTSRDAALATHVRVVLGERPRLPDAGGPPVLVLTRLRLRSASSADDARRRMTEASALDRFVGALARIDPVLAPFITDGD